MTHFASQSLAAALAAFIAVTPLVRHGEAQPEGGPGARYAARSAPRGFGLPGVGMPDTGSGNVPLGPLTVIVNVRATTMTSAIRAELGSLGTWLSTHHGRAGLALVHRRRATALVEPSTIEGVIASRPVRSPSVFARKVFAARAGQQLLVTIGGRRLAKAGGAASLWLPEQRGARVVTAVALRDREAVVQPVDARRRGVVAATAARAIISLVRLREVRP